MGRGNSIIRDANGDTYPTYYIEYYEHDESEEHCDNNPCTCNAYFMSDVLGNIRCSIIDKKMHLDIAYQGTDSNPSPSYYRDSWNNDYGIYFDSKVMQVIITDNEWSIAIGCIPVLNENGRPYNKPAYKVQANKFMRLLNEMYKLSERTGAWTSGYVEVQESDEVYIFY